MSGTVPERTPASWRELAVQAELLAEAIGEDDDAARTSAAFVAMRCRRKASTRERELTEWWDGKQEAPS